MTTYSKTISLGDRYAEVAVVMVTAIALLAGWFYKTGVENRSVPFESGSVTAELPAGWIQSQPEDSLVRATDLTSAGLGTTYTISKRAVDADVTPAGAASLQTLDWSQQLTGFRVLEQEPALVDGQEAYLVSYVFVDYDPNVLSGSIPSVVRGLDYTFVKDGEAITVSYWADQAEFDTGRNRFKRFLNSVKF